MNETSKKSRGVRIGIVQMQCSDVPEENMDKALRMTREAAEKGAEVICLPELFRSRYFCQSENDAHFELAESVPGPSTEAFAAVAAEHDVTIIASLFEKRAAGLYHNTTAVLDRKHGYIGKYRKMHIPDDPRYYEKYYFTPGDLGFQSFGTEKADLGVLICWDQWYPEAARITALLGAEIIFYPTAIGWHPAEKEEWGPSQADAWQTIQRSHAIANGVYVAAANRVGHEPEPGTDGIEFTYNTTNDPFNVESNTLITSMIVLIAFPILTSAFLVLLSDRQLGSQVFAPENGGTCDVSNLVTEYELL